MIDINVLRNEPELIKASQIARGEDPNLVDLAKEKEISYRQAIKKYDEFRAKQKTIGKLVASTKDPKEKQEIISQVQELAKLVQKAQSEQTNAQEEFYKIFNKISNLTQKEVPKGSEENNETLKTVGKIPEFNGFVPLSHDKIGENLDLFDLSRGAKVSGSRFYFLKGLGARLERAVLNLAVDLAVKNNFCPLVTPTLVRPEIMQGTGFLDEHDEEVFHLERDNMYLVGTSEAAIAGFHSDEIIDISNGPLRYAGISTCYRREAGSHGKDTKGIFRVHQFNKIEMFSFCSPLDARHEHKKFLEYEEEMLQAVELPYRVVNIAAGDLGSSASQKFDCEAWIPSQKKYREMTSTSNCTEFQSRRLNIRHRPETGSQTEFVSTINGTMATTRWLVAILENHQQKDGSIKIPAKLKEYL